LISSASTIWGEERPFLETEDTLAVGPFADDVSAEDVGRHQIRRELHAVELQVQHRAEGADQHGLAQAGHAFEQRMAADEQAGQHTVNDLGVADDDLADLAHDPVVSLAELLDRSCIAAAEDIVGRGQGSEVGNSTGDSVPGPVGSGQWAVKTESPSDHHNRWGHVDSLPTAHCPLFRESHRRHGLRHCLGWL